MAAEEEEESSMTRPLGLAQAAVLVSAGAFERGVAQAARLGTVSVPCCMQVACLRRRRVAHAGG